METQPSSASEAGAAFVAALGERDFTRLAGLLAPDVRMRALVPPGPLEASGAEEAVARFSAWFGNAEELGVLRAGSEDVGDRVHVFYRFHVRRPGASRTVIEQHLFCAIDDGRISTLDLVCSGFRPIDEYSRAWRRPGRPVEAMAER